MIICILFCSFARQGKESSRQLQFSPRMLGLWWALSTSRGMSHNMSSHVQFFIQTLCCSSAWCIELKAWSWLFATCNLLRLTKYANSILDSKLRGESPFETYMSRPSDTNLFQCRDPAPVRKYMFIWSSMCRLRNIIWCCVCGLDLVVLGVGYHHAGVDLSDRKLIEEAFTQGDLPVLCETVSLVQFYPVVHHYMTIQACNMIWFVFFVRT